MSFLINPYRFGSYDVDYQAVLDRATALGYTHPSTAKKTIENAAMIAIKAAFGVSSIASAPIFQGLMFKTDGSSDYATLNWVSPSTRQATMVNSPSFTSNLGFNSNGTTSYLTSGLLNVDLDQANFSVAVRAFTNSAIDNEAITGVGDGLIAGTESLNINPRNTGDNLIFRAIGGATGITATNTNATNRVIAGRTSATNVHHSINGAAFTTTASADNPCEISRDITILAFNGSSLANYFTRGISYRWVFSRKLSDAEAAAFDAAIVNYLA